MLPRIWIDELFDAVYPPACWVCGAWAPDAFACAAHRLVRPGAAPRCGRCAVRLGSGLPDGEPCPECRREPPAFSRTFVWGDWGENPLREWVLAFKHGGRRELARPLAAELFAALGPRATEFDVVVPVPLHPLRRFARGYDQAQRLARELAAHAGIDARRCLSRTRFTAPQGAPGAKPRAANVRGAFRASFGARRAVDGRRVLLVDDVVTSGSTVRECAAVLVRAGAADVAVAALARASAPGLSQDPGEPGTACAASGDFDPPPE